MSDSLTKYEGIPLWKAKPRSGWKGNYSDPKVLLVDCIDYLDWCEKNPLKEGKPFAYMGESWVQKVEKMRAPTINGLTVFLGIALSTWYLWREKSHPISETVSRVERIIYDQKLAGAAAGLLSSLIIARELGLKDNVQIDSPVKNDETPYDLSQVSTETLLELQRAAKTAVTDRTGPGVMPPKVDNVH